MDDPTHKQDADISAPKPPQSKRPLAETHICELLWLVRKFEASHLHIAVGLPPVLRVRGQLLQAPYTPFTPEQSRRMIYSIFSENEQRTFESEREIERVYAPGKVGNFRVNAFFAQGNVVATFRFLPAIPAPEHLELPPAIRSLTEKTGGLILAGGPVGSGKSTTLAAMTETINATRAARITVVDSGVLWSIPDKQSTIQHINALDYPRTVAATLQAAVEERPDVLSFLERLNSPELIRIALDYAGPEHLVLATISTRSTVTTLGRIIESFPVEEQPRIRQQLADRLQGIICQQILPSNDGARVCAQEIMIVTPEIRERIRAGDIDEVQQIIETSGHL